MPEIHSPGRFGSSNRARRSRPLLIAPLIPLLGIIGIFGVDQFHGTRYLSAFVAVWCILLSGLFAYVLVRLLEARRARR